MNQPVNRIPDLVGKRVIVTGANSGLGLQTAAALAARGASVTLACRDTDRGAAALEMIAGTSENSSCEVEELDLASLASVHAFADRWEGPLDILINNAGVMATPRRRTQDGFELQFGVNHLGHFALTGLLLDDLRKSPAARIVTISSLAHKRGRIRFDDLNSARSYRRWRAYGQSKVANLLFTMELDRRLQAAGANITAAAAHPGLANTNLTRSSGYPAVLDLLGGFFKLLGQRDSEGALPILYAATDAEVRGGDYYGPDGPGEVRGNPVLVAPAPYVLDEEVALRLWEVSEELTGVAYL